MDGSVVDRLIGEGEEFFVEAAHEPLDEQDRHTAI
jgi:hypothetical protein